jgi:hypothetical protein
MTRPIVLMVALLAACDPIADSAKASERPAACARCFAGRPDAPVLSALASEPIATVKKGVGGRSLAFRVELAGGTRAYFKPAQSFAAHWFSEVAAYHVDRGLGFGRTPPVVSRRVAWSELARAAGSDPRVAEIRRNADGTVDGAMMAWIEGELPALDPPRGWESWLRVEPLEAASPFQRERDWKRGAGTRPRDAPAPDPKRAGELSDLVLFDYLLGNIDRWGGGFTNVRTLGPGGPLVHIDNANGFHRGSGRTAHLDAQLRAVQRFRKRTVAAIRAFDAARLRDSLAREPLAPILDEERLKGFETRRLRVLEHVAAMERRHGAAALPW